MFKNVWILENSSQSMTLFRFIVYSSLHVIFFMYSGWAMMSLLTNEVCRSFCLGWKYAGISLLSVIHTIRDADVKMFHTETGNHIQDHHF